jgi:hypothetical protein
LLQQFPNTSLFFCGHQYFPHLPSKKGEDTTLLIPGDHSNYHFSVIFSLILLWDPPFIYVLGVLLQQLPSKSRKWYWATPIPSY